MRDVGQEQSAVAQQEISAELGVSLQIDSQYERLTKALVKLGLIRKVGGGGFFSTKPELFATTEKFGKAKDPDLPPPLNTPGSPALGPKIFFFPLDSGRQELGIRWFPDSNQPYQFEQIHLEHSRVEGKSQKPAIFWRASASMDPKYGYKKVFNHEEVFNGHLNVESGFSQKRWISHHLPLLERITSSAEKAAGISKK